MNGDKRYHAEVKIELEGRECRINAFRDTLEEIFQDIGTICSEYPQDWINPPKREIVNPAPKAPAKPAAGPQQTGQIPVCEQCGSSEFMELIKFTDKMTGKPRQAWKCQQCLKWHFENGKKK